MKPFRPDILRRQLVPGAALVALTALIWLGWPQLSSVPPTATRLYLTAAIYLTWLLKLILIDFTPPTSAAHQESPELQKQLRILDGRLTGIMQFLRKTPLLSHGIHTRFAVLPWHLLIGPTGSGKTSLLAHSGMRYVLSKKFPEETLSALPPSTTPEWWVTRDLVLIDAPGTWSLWQHFLDLLQKKNAHTQLSGVVLALNLPELMDAAHHAQWERIMDSLKKQIAHLQSTLGNHLSYYLAITKCDQLPGFTEFFRDCSREDLAGAWGVSLPIRKPEERLQDVICKRFNHLIRQLNSQLVLRLHHERDIRMRPLIKDFPLEVERLRDGIVQCINTIAPDLPLRGIWLTSATQKPSTTTAGQTLAGETTQLTLHMEDTFAPAPPAAKPYFIRQLLQQSLPGWSGKISQTGKNQTLFQRAVYTISTLVLLLAAFVIGRNFSEGLTQINQLQAGIRQYATLLHEATPMQPRLTDTLALLNTLQTGISPQDKSLLNIALSQKLLSFYTLKSRVEAGKIHRQALQTLLLPALGSSLDAWLKNINKDTPHGQLYDILAARLMLAGKIPAESQRILQALISIGTLSAHDEASTGRLLDQLNQIQQNHFILPSNPALIEQARSQLLRLPVYQLGMLLLENSYKDNTAQNETFKVPALFTRSHFDEVMQKDIAGAARQILHGNAVLGTLHPHSRQQSSNGIVMQLRNRYRQSYVRAWTMQLYQLHLTAPTDLFAADAMISDFIKGSAPLMQALRTVHENTDFLPLSKTTPALSDLNAYFNEDANSTRSVQHQTAAALNWLHQILSDILTADDPGEAAFRRVMQVVREPEHNPFVHLHQMAAKNPEPLKTWMTVLADAAWKQLIRESGVTTVSSSLVTALKDAGKVPLTEKPQPREQHTVQPMAAALPPPAPPAIVHREKHPPVQQAKNTSEKQITLDDIQAIGEKIPDNYAKSNAWTLNLNLPQANDSV